MGESLLNVIQAFARALSVMRPGSSGAVSRTAEQLICLFHGRWSLSTDLHSLSSNLFSRWCSRFQQQIYAQIRIQKEKQENNTQPGGFLIGTAVLPGVVKKPSRVSAVWRSCGQPAASAAATARPGQSFRDSPLPLCSSFAGSPGLRELGGEGEGGSPDYARQLSHLACHDLSATSHPHECGSRLHPPGVIFLSSLTVSPILFI